MQKNTSENLDFSSIAIASITYYPKWYKGLVRSNKHTDKIRGDLAIEFAKKATGMGMHVIFVDGLSTHTFHKEVEKIPGLIYKKRRSRKRSPNRRLGITIAAKIPGIKVIIQSEAEKVSLIDDCIIPLVRPILEDQADLVIPQRNTELFKRSYPTYMYESEVEGNKIYNEALRAYGLVHGKTEDFDLFFGPRAFKNDKKIISLYMRKYHLDTHNLSFPSTYFDLEELSNAQFFPIILALKKMLRVASVEVSFVYPKLQKENEEKGEKQLFQEKRKAQRLSLIVELMHFLSYLDKNPASRLKKIKNNVQ